jgi:hypothetical protein
MPLYWLCYRHNNQIVIEPGTSLIHARMRAALAELDQGEFTEGHELDCKMRVPKELVGPRLSQEGAKRLLACGRPAAVATSRAGQRPPRSGRAGPRQRWGRGLHSQSAQRTKRVFHARRRRPVPDQGRSRGSLS